MLDIAKIRADFPELSIKINGKRNTFLDTAASAQKPKCVIDNMVETLTHKYANVHRGSYELSEQLTYEYEQARKQVAKFINAKSEKEIVFTRNATESINLVAATYGRSKLKSGDEILISEAEHHANLIPWQMIAEEKSLKLKVFKINDDGSFNKEEFLSALSDKTKLVAVTAMSNVLGTIFPIAEITKSAHQTGAKVLVDACQYAVHSPVDVQNWDCDFVAFSGHKIYGPTGIGVLFGKYDLLCEMPPYQTGGEMIDTVTYEKTSFALPPARFEAGTPAIVEALGMAEALRYVESLGWDNIISHEQSLTEYTRKALDNIKGLTQVGTAKEKGGVFSFVVDNIHPQDLAFILSREGVSIRTGHHCAEPLVHRMGYETVARASLGVYSDKEDIDILVKSIEKAKTFF